MFDYSKPHKMIDNKPVYLTQEEIAQIQADSARYAQEAAAYKLKADAKADLVASDINVLRFLEKQMPKEWQTYRQNMRDVAEGRTTEKLNKPEYPV